MMADADDEPQPFFAPEPVEEADSDAEIVEEDGPQPGNEITPTGGRRRAAAGTSSRPARGGRSSKTAKPRTPSAARAPRAAGARKNTRGRGRGGE